MKLGECSHNSYWKVAYDGTCMVCRAEQAEARVQALEARLEIDHAYDQDMQRIEIPVEQRDKFPDGIACRDATIQLQDERVKELEQEHARLKDLLRELADLQNGPPLEKYARSWQACMDRVYRALEGG